MKRIGLIGAMDVEVEIIKKEMEIGRTEERAGLSFCIGRWQGREIVVVRSGIGKVNAALCAQILADLYEVGIIINTGVAGGLDPRLHVGDLVVSSGAVEHDMDVTALGEPYGQVPNMDVHYFEADPDDVELALAAGRKVLPEVQMIAGVICSGDQFIAGAQKKEWLIETFGGVCAEMEGAAIAHTCYVNGLPYLVLRGISDNADGSAGMSYEEFAKLAVVRITDLVREVVSQLPEQFG
ncbi:MAG: 5'-methylthioadenosine/adenosylhomocysteine nucleosidase [Lachnospiraceae bacterium]|nr:5'-methylthioadenosine/adenosylhomocysteine nucleosidase [Lachnospiraceae bacterium]